MNAIALTIDPLALHDLVPPASLAEARTFRDDLGRLLRREREAAADFLVALADFDRRRGWERLGHASLFSFLTRELRLSSGAAQLRLSAARLLPRHPAVEEALRAGRLCISAVGQLARVLTPANEAEVLPRFFGLSAREAQEVVAAVRPAPAPPRREVVTPVPMGSAAQVGPGPSLALTAAPRPAAEAQPAGEVRPAADSLHTCEVSPSVRRLAPPAAVEPLTADLRRLHLTVSRGLLEKIARAKAGLSHALPCATTEQVLEAALDLLLEKQARAKALVRRPRSALARAGGSTSAVTLDPERDPASSQGPTAASTATLTSTVTLTVTPTTTATVTPTTTATATPTTTATATPTATSTKTETPTPPTSASARPRPLPLGSASSPPDPRAIPAAVEREVRLRDGDRCAFPLDAGGTCGSTWQVELDHVVPVALGGMATASNLRCACRRHNRLAAEHALGGRADGWAGRRRPAGGRR